MRFIASHKVYVVYHHAFYSIIKRASVMMMMYKIVLHLSVNNEIKN